MAAKMDEALDTLLKQTQKERAKAAQRLLDSLESEPEAEVDQAWREEVLRRQKQLSRGEVATVPWEEVKRRVQGRLDQAG